MRKRRPGQAPYLAVFTATAPPGPGGARRLEGLRQALMPEAGRGLPGAAVGVRATDAGRAVEVRIEADSLRSLRAAINSYLRWSALALEVAGRAGGSGEEE